MERLLENKVAFITGSASGIGKETALLFAKEGAKVMISDINEEQGNEAVEDVKKIGGEAAFVKCNVANYQDVQNLLAATVKHFGRLDVAVNNAGIGGSWQQLAEYDHAEYDKIIAINQTGVFYCLQVAIKQMLSQKSAGSIVNISSVAGLKAMPFGSPYVASKHAVIGLTKTAAVEYARAGIRVNAICPVFTLTPLFKEIFKVDASYEEKLMKTIPMRRYGKPEEIAEAITWLCSDRSGFVTGQAISLDGGSTA